MRKKSGFIIFGVITSILLILVFAVIYYNVKYSLYNPIETLKVEEATIKMYFSSREDVPYYDAYKGKKPDYKKHRLIEYHVKIGNTGPRNKNCILLIPLVPKEFNKYIIAEDKGFLMNVSKPKSGKIFSIELYYAYLTEGDPQKVKEIISKNNKAKIIWEEGGKKYEKIIDMKVKILD